jgi:hypothetical protein
MVCDVPRGQEASHFNFIQLEHLLVGQVFYQERGWKLGEDVHFGLTLVYQLVGLGHSLNPHYLFVDLRERLGYFANPAQMVKVRVGDEDVGDPCFLLLSKFLQVLDEKARLRLWISHVYQGSLAASAHHVAVGPEEGKLTGVASRHHVEPISQFDIRKLRQWELLHFIIVTH